jgi:hypothetical protein
VQVVQNHISYDQRSLARQSAQSEWPCLTFRSWHDTVPIQGVYPLGLVQIGELGLAGPGLADIHFGRQPIPRGLPFRRITWGRVEMLTNGYTHLPIESPGDEVVTVPGIGKVSRRCWPQLIAVLEGRAVENVGLSVGRLQSQTWLAEPRDEESRRHNAAQPECYCPADVEQLFVAGNSRYMFQLGSGHDCLWIVDCLNGGALYIFDDKEEAFDWLTERMRGHMAQRVGHRIIHVGDWRAKAAAAVKGYLG